MMTPADVRDVESEAEIAAFLAGAPRRPRAPVSFASAAVRHGVAPLLVKAGVSAWLPADAAATLAAEARRQAVLCTLRDRDLTAALAALHRAKVPALVMKGSALAHTVYAESHLRPRYDSDLLIRPSDRERAVSALSGAGYRLGRGAINAEALGQMLFDKPGAPAAALDVHWEAATIAAAAAWFDFDTLLARSVPLPGLGTAARGPCAVDGLALACVHLAAHHPGHEMLLWWYDIHLLAGALGGEERDDFLEMTRARGMARVCLDAVGTAAARFRLPQSAELALRLRSLADDEPPAPLLGRRRKLDDLRLDLATLGWRRRIARLRAHLFPPAEYMRETYAPRSRAPLSWLYVRRMVRGAHRWRR